jgi:hypothetical protein
MDAQMRDRRTRRWVAGAAVAALGLTGLVLSAGAAQAAGSSVSGVELDWALNAESGGGAYFGGCNFLSAGAAGNTGSSRVWTQADGFYSTQDGNVTVEKPTASGGWEQPTWSTKCQDSAGKAVTTAATSTSGNRVELAGGTGTVDVTAGTADITWDGSFTVVYYGGLTYWTATDPELKVAADGTATLTATASGWGASMDDPNKWDALASRTVTLAYLTGVTVDVDGFTVTPDYLGVAVSTGSGTAQLTSGATWGSFPQSFVDFQQLTGQSSYWYSSGGANDARKVASPLSVAWEVPVTPVYHPAISVTPSTGIEDGDTLTVTGTGFDTTTANAYTGGQAGAYVELGWITPGAWKPSEGYAGATRANVAAVWVHDTPKAGAANEAKLEADGSFTVTLTVDAAALQAKKLDGASLAVFTVAAGGATSAGSEASALLAFADASSSTGDIPVQVTVPEKTGGGGGDGEFAWTIAGSGAVDLGTATQGSDGFAASGALRQVTVTDTRADAPAWTISGAVGDFAAAGGTPSFSGSALGWTPAVSANTVGAVAGGKVVAGSGDGLSVSRTLASAAAGHPAGDVTVDAGLDLLVPLDTPAGDYTGTLTLTAVG